MNIFLSVIIPIYNTSAYLQRCVTSLLDQTIDDGIEFVFIDDASNDDSLVILKRIIALYPHRQSQISIICHEENMGIAFSRREGILLAKGQYIGWCDSDDWCDPDMFRQLLSIMQADDSDISVCNYLVHEGDSVRTETKNYHSNPREHIRLLYLQPDSNMFLWHVLFRRSLFLENRIYPYEGLNIGEDLNLSIRAFCKASKLSFTPNILYHHNNNNSQSLVKNNRKDTRARLNNDCRNTDLICSFLEQEGADEFYLTCQFLRFQTKWGFDALFGYTRPYFDLYSCTHHDLRHFNGIPSLLRCKMMLLFHSYISFCFFSSIYRMKQKIFG